MKLKYTEIKQTRERILVQQDGCCALCQHPIVDDAVLDHDHKSGKIRRVLHRGCNALLGKIENNMPRNRITMERLRSFSENLISYLEEEYADIVHPTYKTSEERKMQAKVKKAMGRGRGKGKKPPKR